VFTGALPSVPILSQVNPIHTIQSYLSKIQFNIVHPPTSWSSQWSPSFWLSHQYPLCIPPLHRSCPSHPNYIWWRVQVMKSSLCSPLQPPVTSSLFGPDILLSTLFSNTLSLRSSRKVRDEVLHS
jgi:hypothetical protein